MIRRAAKRLVYHIISHPWRLAATLALMMGLSAALSVAALIKTFDQNHENSVTLCRNINELRVELYNIEIDSGTDEAIASRLLKLTDCENLP